MTESETFEGKFYEVEFPSGKNYEKAAFRLWIPDKLNQINGVLVAISGSNRDSKPFIEPKTWSEFVNWYNTRHPLEVSSTYWQDIAIRHNLGLMGCHFKDKPHDKMFIEEYCDVKQGSGQVLLDALVEFSKLSGHSEIAEAPLVFWGMSAGGQFNYEFACWKPERVIAFVVNKGGFYYTALAPEETRRVPSLFFIGEKDQPNRTRILNGIFSMNRKGDALWTLVIESGAVHEVGRSLELSEIFFDEVIPLRLPGEVGGALRPLILEDGYDGDFMTMSYYPFNEGMDYEVPTSWIATEKMAKAWKAVMKGEPI